MKKTILLYWISFVVATILVLSLSFGFESFVTAQYNDQNFSLLNKLAKISENANLDYYLGRIEDEWVGPLANVLCFVLFTSFSLIYLRKTNPIQFASAVFVFLIVTKFNILFFPPYGDAIGGPLAEGWWLAKHNFDYIGLLHEPAYQDGGARVYYFSIYPTFIGILYRIFPNTKLFLVINHLIVFALAAGIASCIREVLKRQLDEKISIITAMIVLALPIFQSQTEAINMELPCLFFSVLSIYHLIRRNIGYSALFACLSLLVKGHGLIPSATFIVVVGLLMIFNQISRTSFKTYISIFAVLGLSLFKVFSKYLLKDQHVTSGIVKLFSGLPSLKIMTLPWWFFISLAVFICLFVVRKAKFKENISLKMYFDQGVIFLCSLFWFLLFLNFYAVSPRYKLALAPYLVMCVVYAFVMVPLPRKLICCVLFGALGLTSLGSYGLYHYRLPANYHVMSERSLQYRNNVKMDMKIARDIEENHTRMTIGAPFIWAQMLAIPEFGYVDKKLDVLAYGMPVKYGNIKNFEGLKKEDIIKTMWLGVAAQYVKKNGFSYPMHAQDKLVKEYTLGDNEAVLFRGGFAIEQRYRMTQMAMRFKANQ